MIGEKSVRRERILPIRITPKANESLQLFFYYLMVSRKENAYIC